MKAIMTFLQKALCVGALILSLGFSLDINQAHAATLYTQPYIGTDMNLGTSEPVATRYYGYFFGGATLANPPSGLGFWVATDTVNKVRVHRVSGVSCNVIANSIFIIDSNFNQVGGSMPGGVAVGDDCDVNLAAEIPAGTQVSAIYFVAQNVFASDMVLSGSPNNAGVSINGLNDAQIAGGFAFQFCHDVCDAVFVTPTSTSEKSITSFSFQDLDPVVDGAIDDVNHVINVTVPYGTDVSSLVPTVGISSGASVTPDSNVSQDFSSPVTYTVTGSDGGTQSYTVTVIVSPPEKPDPVIIIPGILGSADKDGEWVIDPIFHVYDDLFDTLKVNGYVPGQDLFTFPYEWRDSNVNTAILLRLKINEVKQICGCDKVDLVAHSMGGLVAREYIQSDKYQNDVDQLIFLGTPHLGAPKDYLQWEGARTMPDVIDEVINFILSREAKENGYSNLFDYIHTRPIPSVQQLLPTYDYLKTANTGVLKTYPIGYPQNAFLENLNNNVDKLFNSGVKITNIIGDNGKNDTLNIIRVVSSINNILWSDGYPEGFDNTGGDKGLEQGVGDGTVPLNSANFINKNLNQIVSTHKDIPLNAEGLIYKKLTGKDASTLITKYELPSAKLLIIKLLSPVDMVVTAPDGKKIGKDFTTGQEINEIDSAFYSGFKTDDEYVTILNPLDGNYKVETVGTENGGEYTVATGYITDTTSASQDFIAQTAPGMIADLTIGIDNSHPTQINVERTDITTSTMIDDINRLYTLGWIKKINARDSLVDKVNKAIKIEKKIEILETIEKGKKVQKKIEKLERKFDKILGKEVAKELENKHNKDIMNDQAYQILKDDINWLLTH